MEKSYHHADLRTALIEKALEYVQSDKVHLIGFRELARQLDVSRTAPYRHFESVEHLLASVAEEGFRNFLSRLRHATSNSTRVPLEKFSDLAKVYLDFALDHPAHYRLMFDQKFYSKERFPEVTSLATESFDLLVKAIAACLNDEVTKKDRAQLATIAWAFVHGLARLFTDGQLEEIKNRKTFVHELCMKFGKIVQ